MRILILCDDFATRGGAGRIAQILTEELSKEHKVRVLTAHCPPDLKSQSYKIFTHNLDYLPVFRNYLGLYHPKAVRILRQYLQQHHPEVVFIHNLHTNWSYYALKILRDFDIPSVLTFHDVAAFTPYVKLCNYHNYHYPWWRHWRDAKWTYNPFRNFLIKKYLRYATRTVAVSQELKKALEANGIRVDRVIYNGIELNLSHTPSLIKEGVRGSSGVIFFGGRLSTSKGMLLAVKYLKVLKDKYNLTPRLRVAGEKGVGAEKMTLEAKKLRVIEQLDFLGWLDEKNYELKLSQATMVIVPSICFDSLPTIILEAMRFKKPVVATNLGGAKEIIVDGVTGYIEDPSDNEKFTARIAELLQNQKLAEEMGKAARERLIKEFSIQKMTDAYFTLTTSPSHPSPSPAPPQADGSEREG